MVGSESIASKIIKAWLLGIFKIKLKTVCECAVAKVLQLQICFSFYSDPGSVKKLSLYCEIINWSYCSWSKGEEFSRASLL